MFKLFVFFMDFIIFPFLVVYGILSKNEYAIYAANLTIFIVIFKVFLMIFFCILLSLMYNTGMLDDKEKMMSNKKFRDLKEKSVERTMSFILDCVLVFFMAATGHFIIAFLFLLNICIGLMLVGLLLSIKKSFMENENDTISNH